MKYPKMTWGKMEAIINKLGGEKAAEKFLRGELEVVEKMVSIVRCCFELVVNYDLSIKELVKGYNDVEEDITDKNFPSTQKGEKKLRFELYQFLGRESISSEEVISEMKKMRCRPATMKELLFFGNKNPDFERDPAIYAIGSVVKLNGSQQVGWLGDHWEERNVGLDDFNSKWYPCCRFLAVCKEG